MIYYIMKEKLLLHTCCGPCFLATEPELANSFKIVSYFYNPNIFPESEFEKRKENLEKVISHFDEQGEEKSQRFLTSVRNDRKIEVITEKWNHKDWSCKMLRIAGLESNNKNLSYRSRIKCGMTQSSVLDSLLAHSNDNKIRCRTCWETRLEKTAQKATELKIKNISTTLLSSIYQDFEKISEIGKNLAKKYNLKFVIKDFRKNYYYGQNKARELEIYRQKYCGCHFSKAKIAD